MPHIARFNYYIIFRQPWVDLSHRNIVEISNQLDLLFLEQLLTSFHFSSFILPKKKKGINKNQEVCKALPWPGRS